MIQETKESRVTLPEHDPGIISRVIGFIYTNKYDWSKVPEVFLSIKKAKDNPKEPVFVQQLHIHLELA